MTISDSSPGVTIHYTTNGTTPTSSSPVYTASVRVSTTTAIKAIAVGGGLSPSFVGSATYLLTAATPTFRPVGGTYPTAQSVTISDTSPSVTIHYTTNGTTPTSSSPVYTGLIRVSTTTTIKAMAAGGGFAASAVATATYTIQ
ncbi:MAG: chitobiase/beta-hexosaminidase C-terminal domain-containing protein [Bryobacteraceae bacterium]